MWGESRVVSVKVEAAIYDFPRAFLKKEKMMFLQMFSRVIIFKKSKEK